LPNYLLFLLQLIWQDRQERQARLAAIPQLRQMGLTPEQIATALNLPLDEVESYGKG
jgi:predicted transposase YdaD